MGSYDDAKHKYAWTDEMDEAFTRLTRAADFDALDFEIEEFEDKPTGEQVESILTEFNDRMRDDDDMWYARLEHMRDAIREVMGDGYLDR